MATLLDQYTESQIRQFVQESHSFAECCRKVGYSDKGRYGPDRLKEYCAKYNISTSHFSQTGNMIKAMTLYTLDEILVEHSTYRNIDRLKKRLVSEGRLKYICAFCGNIGIWNNQPLTLELDHINGVHDDHRLENLRFLCPNCHSQTKTFSGRNKITKTTTN